jgi:hypothetical protein
MLFMLDHSTAGAKNLTRAQEIFKSAKPEYQNLFAKF